MDALLGDPAIDIVINLTVPLAHGPVSRHIITAGKHVYSEKPLAARFSEGQALMLAAAGRGVRVRLRPRYVLGAAHQACRRAIDAGLIGRPVGAPRPCSRTAWSTGTPIPSSSSSAAAVRSTTSGLTTSPSWSTCWDPSRGSPPRPRWPATPAPSRASLAEAR